MKAAQITEYGTADVVHVVEVGSPQIKPDMVLVEVHAGSVNPWDIKVRSGLVKDSMPLEFPATLGGDFAGVVTAVGEHVTHVALGDKVYGEAQGAFAEFALAKASEVAPMPNNLDFVQAAVAPLTGMSAVQVIYGHMQLKAGQKILIHGGAGGIGTMAIQIAKHLGAYVATTATGDGLAYVKNLGADEAIDYKAEKFEDLVHDFDAVFDTIGGETYERSFQALKPGGVIVSMLMPPNQELMSQYNVRAIAQQTRTTVESLETLAELIEVGAASVHVDKTYPLEQVADAFRALETGGVKGKVAVIVHQ